MSAKKPLTARGQELAVEAHHLGRLLDRPERRPGHHRLADVVRTELERGDDAEVAAAPAQGPEQLGVLVGAGVHLRAVGEHDVGADEAVDREAEASCQVAEPATERQPADAGRRDDPRRRRTAMLRRHAVDVAPGGAAPDSDRVRVRIDNHVGHPGEVDDDAVVDDAQSGTVVAAAADGDRRVVGACEGKCARDVRGARAAHDQRRMPVDHRVVDGARLVVARIAGADDAVVEIGEVAARDVGEGNGGAHGRSPVAFFEIGPGGPPRGR
jgi:hypothetical protein